jgi:glucokinase
MSSTTSLGIDLGGSSVKADLLTAEGRSLARFQQAFDPSRPGHFAETIRDLVQHISAVHAPPDRIGLSAPGLASPDERSIAFMPGRLEGLVHLDWTQFLQSTSPIPVLNDAHAALLGEVWLGAAKGASNVVLITLGTGVGGAAMVDGRLLRGHTGKAGHLGHVCLDIDAPPDITGMPGGLEDAIGNCTIIQRGGGRYRTTHDLIQAHQAGDPEAARIWLRSVKALACAIGSFTNVLDPELVILGGGIARAGDLLFEPVRRMVSEVEWKVCGHEVSVVPARLGEYAGACGAAWNALRHPGPCTTGSLPASIQP